MLNIPQLLATELDLKLYQVQNALELLAEGATIPFIARYRKERTNEMDEVQLRNLSDRYTYLTELEERKAVILNAIANQGKLTDELKAQITSSLQKTELEDLYLPYKQKRRTRATIAREKGLEPLAEFIKSLNVKNPVSASLETEAAKYISETQGVKSAQEALKGASDILAEEVAERAESRAYIRDYLLESGIFTSRIKDEHPEGTTKFEMYRNYQAKVKNIAPHNILALCRGEAEGVLNFEIAFDEDIVLSYLESQEIKTKVRAIRDFYQGMIKDAFNRLMKTSLMGEVIAEKKAYADFESIKTFETNLRELLLSAPAGMKPTLAIDPGFRTGCKVAVINQTGKFLEYQAVFPHQAAEQRTKAAQTLKNLIEKYKIELIAIGNGTASRETEEFVSQVLQAMERKPTKVMVNESGASIYSASKVALEEFPDLDVTVRGAISIGRRLQDPLAELVKIDPKSIGVGQYQHDVDQKLLKKKLDETVESCVNYVGVDLNTASKELLTFVSGITPAVANNIVTYRNENGAFKNRRQLLKVPKLGPKAFEQAAGFLRIRNGENPLDNTAVHPESYSVVEAIASDLNVPLNQVTQIAAKLQKANLKKYVTDTVGEPTLRDILSELEKPGRDPRAEFKYATFKEGITEIKDLQEGMELEGIITNVANFGAFVDIGVHQDGLVHISQLADRFVEDPKKIVKVGQVVKVRVLEVNEKLKRISLSMKAVRQG
ncbi:MULTISPECIES: Tex family protein [unclassified Tolypothrix]|uniref:Tex family protein n=1 Tax=unclassified Tolypothrix TaxID=2649714 RepID=UPI0005EAC509|nr:MULTISPECIES: Tex family protein [unclassified Tolypothrix]BAY89619.1 RNA-binding S1 domain-containing protein [Microchaete diplosiphon NIES-3275]EKF02609.1 transcriptional accessory protein [Tolypothrix sp. PCC 7601]MBE9084762.1 RNA-binding transcriptional accessory protein [Tolypothrix sp. LEGE 11397]UYD23889.1 RNA-binding transcriptional accessory protein [Tolypothrix sp. PCC 7712]UYD33886.1 RNA-binding transcriptional accessory protein [Tolypothrix sp. PCC 7601]